MGLKRGPLHDSLIDPTVPQYGPFRRISVFTYRRMYGMFVCECKVSRSDCGIFQKTQDIDLRLDADHIWSRKA